MLGPSCLRVCSVYLVFHLSTVQFYAAFDLSTEQRLSPGRSPPFPGVSGWLTAVHGYIIRTPGRNKTQSQMDCVEDLGICRCVKTCLIFAPGRHSRQGSSGRSADRWLGASSIKVSHPWLLHAVPPCTALNKRNALQPVPGWTLGTFTTAVNLCTCFEVRPDLGAITATVLISYSSALALYFAHSQ